MQASTHSVTRSRPSSDATIELRRELMNWADPVIADCILNSYRERDIEATLARLLSSQHRRLWRAVLLEHRSLMGTLWHTLQDDLSAAGMANDVAESINQCVFEELFDIVLKRFRTSNEKVKACSMILLGAASCMGTSPALQ